MNSRLVFLFALVIAGSIDSCRTTTDTVTTGIMTGTMSLVDASCNYASPDSVTVELLGTKFKGLSDTDGIWKISEIPAGYYDIQFSKPGYARSRVNNVEFVGAGTLDLDLREPTAGAEHLGPRSTTTVALSNVTTTVAASSTPSRFQGDSIVTVNVLATPTTAMSKNDVLTLYCSKSPNVDLLDPSTYFYAGSWVSLQSHFSFSEKMIGLHAGDTVYVIAGFMNNCSTLSYSDSSGNNIYPAVGPLSTPVAMVIP